ncbi:DUF6094 domain-containing protein [Algiphilus sp. W345]|uniref:DUF6094 domain-containing protein n=1 Tax=Banduia mediterranea TaxID=3075609 RepID=A0ABU2WMY0_9GAMM|nr:DUF6094 domain-containing protein [Algiphilus sp. W345]MDT0498594.1 DUF6094 domain-containing protein [Algiphilus sp. W345]
MALMFQRLARNFIKNGYFPTDADTTLRLLQAIEPCPAGELRILDPCCGEGVALAEVKHHLGSERTTAYGVEYDEERAWHAKTLLDHCIHGDLQDCVIGRRQFGLLWLNPPYGDLVTDRQGVATSQKGRQRLEKLFYQRCHSDLQYGGLLVLIVPVYALDRELSGWIATHFDRVRVFGAAVDTFRQVVVLGRRRRADGTDTALRARLEAIGHGDAEAPPLPEVWTGERYTVPPATSPEVRFAAGRLDPKQLADEIRAGRDDSLARDPAQFTQGTAHVVPPALFCSRSGRSSLTVCQTWSKSTSQSSWISLLRMPAGHTGMASRSTRSRNRAGKDFGVSTSTCTPSTRSASFCSLAIVIRPVPVRVSSRFRPPPFEWNEA